MTPITSKNPFQSASNSPIFIARGDLNKALFMGKHYTHNPTKKTSHLENNTIKITLSENDQGKMSIHAEIKPNSPFTEIFNLTFSKSNSHLTFTSGAKRSSGKQDTPLRTIQDLQNTLICLYKHVRLGVDKKWNSDFEIALDARAAAGQPLDTGMLPQIFFHQNKLTYTSPKIGKDKICDGNCGRCKAALNFI